MLTDDEVPSPAEIEACAGRIGAWATAALDHHPAVIAVDTDPELRRWYVRIAGEEKDVSTIWITVGQRTVRFETYVMPAPEERRDDCYAYLLRQNHHLVGVQFTIGDEDAVYLVGQQPVTAVDAAVCDWIVGTTWATVERCFRVALRIGFGSRLRRTS